MDARALFTLDGAAVTARATVDIRVSCKQSTSTLSHELQISIALIAFLLHAVVHHKTRNYLWHTIEVPEPSNVEHEHAVHMI